MEFESLNFWSPESAESETHSRQIPDCPSAIFSPIQADYLSYLEFMEMEHLQGVAGEEEEEEGEKSGGGGNEEEEEQEDENGRGGGGGGGGGGVVEDGVSGNGGCKNLLSERNRRKRLNQQLLALRSLVPCISKMDKRSILMDAATYLQNLHQETEEIKREIAAHEETSDSSTISSESNLTFPEETIQCNANESSPSQHQILNIEIEELDERTFAIKVVFRRARGALAQVQRMIESLGYNISNTWTHEIDPHQMITTSFLQVKKQMNLTTEMLRVQMSKAAFKIGLELDMDDLTTAI